MIKSTQRSLKIAAAAIIFVLISLVMAGVSMFYAYIPTQTVRSVFHLWLPIVFALFSLWLVLYGRWYREHKSLKADVKVYAEQPNPFFMFFAMTALLYVYSLLFGNIFAIPTKIFSNRLSNIDVTVDHLDGFRANHGYWVWVEYHHNSAANKFMWKWSDPLMDQLKHGDCIMLHVRRWPLGIYVDSISRSNVCEKNDKRDGGN